jgi:bifunctional DNA-binding transcriptional regulator/antitoxin component of YhaV-PrlF toxin-antitoxin module
MRNATTRDITNAIDQLVIADALFTSFDVTKSIRHSGLHVLHHEVKKVVNFYDMASHDYERETHDLGNGHSAFVYYPRWEDINDYDPNKVPEFQITSQNGASAQTKVKVTANATGILDKRGRFTVPAKYVKSIDLRPYSQVTFDNVNGIITIRKADSKDSKSATVDKYWNIRIPRREFENAFNKVPTDSELKIASNNDPVSPEITVFI